MRAWRWVRRGFMTAVLVVPAGLIGTVVALGWSTPGRHFSSRLASSLISDAMAGHITIGSIEGNLINTAILRGVEIHDSLNRPIVQVARLEAHYHLLDLYRGRLVFADVTADTGVVHVALNRAGRWNYQDVFRSGRDSVPSKPPLIQFSNVTLRNISLRVDVPTVPKAPPVPISRNATPAARPRIEAGADGPLRVYTAEHLDARLKLLRVSTPKDDPIRVTVTSLRAVLSDPAVTIDGLQGEFITAADSLHFTLTRAALPGTVVAGAGAVRWPHDTILFDFHLAADTVDLKDLRWISPDFPDWQGRGQVIARSANGTRTAYQLDQLRLGDGHALAAGSMTALVDLQRGLGFNGLNLALTDVPLVVAKPYLDTLPFLGLLNGRLGADGFLDTMRLRGDLTFADALVEGTPRSHFVIDGAIHFGGNEGAIFDGFTLSESAIPLATVRRVVPAMVLPGTLVLDGRLDGPWTRVNFTGTAEHDAPDLARSRMTGRVLLDTRDTILGVDLDANFDPLSFDGLRSGYPSIKARGGLTGRLALRGRLDSLMVEGNMTGEIGTIALGGHLGMSGTRYTTDSLTVAFTRLDTDALLGKWGNTSFSGHALLHGTIDSGVPPRGEVAFGLDRSRIGNFIVEAAEGRIRADSGLALIDTLRVDLPEGWVDVEGNLGLDKTHAGTLLVDAGFTTLAPFDSLLRATVSLPLDTIGPRKLGGTVHGNFTVTGSVDDPMVNGIVQARDLVLDRWRIARIFADVKADSMGWRALEVNADADTLGHADQIAERASLRLGGRLDSLRIAFDGRMYRSSIAALAQWAQRDSTGGSGQIDSLRLTLPGQSWRLARAVPIAFGDRRAIFSDTLLIQASDGSGQISVGGSLPGDLPGDLTVSVVGVDVHDVASMIQRDSSIMGGRLSLDFRLQGTAAAPILHGTTALTGPVFGDIRVPMIRAAFDYEDRRLHSQLTFWKTGEPLMQADISLPLDLAFSPEGERKLPGNIEITAHADSADLGLLEAFTSDVRGARGLLDLDLRGSGTWNDPHFEGMARIDNGLMRLPSLNVEYSDISARIHFAGDSLVMDSVKVSSDGGHLYARGSVRFEQLTSPRIDLNVRTSGGFLLMDVPNYFTLRPSGEVTLRGPLLRPVMTGQVALASSQIYYTDFVTKSLVDLGDPLFADLVDTVAIRKLGIGRSFQNRFMDSLRIDALRFRVEEDVWLRSSEANILLTSNGDVLVTKNGKDYYVDGSFNAARGTYDLTFSGALTKTFNIDRGTVSFFNTKDLNAIVSLQASHTVRTEAGEEIPVIASISGEIRAPDITLTTPGHNLSDRDRISYLFLGRPFSEVGVNSAAGTAIVKGGAYSFISSAFSQNLSRSLGVDVNISGIGTDRYGAALSRQIGDQAFVTLSGTVCSVKGKVFSMDQDPSFGTTIEYRLDGSFRVQASYEKVQTCLGTTGTNISTGARAHQFGLDLLFRREY